MADLVRSDAQPSPIATTIDLLGDRLTVAILRDAFVDRIHRFGEWIDRTGAPPAVLSARLVALTESGLMERRPQLGGYDRHDYVLTGLGLATWEFLVSVWTWQREWSVDGLLQPEMVHVDCGRRGPPEMVCGHCRSKVRTQDARLEVNPDLLVTATGGSRRRSTRSSPALSRADLQFTEVMEAIGDRWSAMVTGLSLSGVRRFGEFQSVLRISPTTLTERLTRLCEAKILTRIEGGREYALTPRGRALFPIFAFLLAWTQTAHPDVPPELLGPRLRHHDCGAWLEPTLSCRGCDTVLDRTSIAFEY
ncbi:DNA-binding HxlR family transcriptional regulator [Rhodococcus sp. 27YEA15]|uniref:winged helix-turn-helix transcriptional regulator n=1 Tax=Rhodococcus sp. 27YEA15 TaxID=3156259 RepID=UPI003C7BF8CF